MFIFKAFLDQMTVLRQNQIQQNQPVQMPVLSLINPRDLQGYVPRVFNRGEALARGEIVNNIPNGYVINNMGNNQNNMDLE